MSEKPPAQHEKTVAEVVFPRTNEFIVRRKEIARLVQLGFAGEPWNETISDEDALNRIDQDIERPGFEAFFIEDDGQIVGALWYDSMTLETLSEQRGEELVEFVKNLQSSEGIKNTLWARDSVVHPSHQGKGYATKLRKDFLDYAQANLEEPTLVLTRMRQDNHAILRIAEKFDYKSTGIYKEVSQNPGVFHQYWYKIV